VSYNIIVNIAFVGSVLAVIYMVLRRLPEATTMHHKVTQQQKAVVEQTHNSLFDKGLPVKAYSGTKKFFLLLWHRISQFLLEAKGLKQAPKVQYNFQKVAPGRKADVNPALVKSEQYFIDLIKRNPKDYTYYDMLGQFYIEEKKMTDAISVYDYLVNHAPTQVTYWVRLGLAALYIHDYAKAQMSYEKALKLDPSNPSRFYNLALALQGQKKYSEAVKALNSALELDHNNQKYFDLRFELESKAKTVVPLENIHKKE
jgi:tetratricopeptide (TPR) repeat protein